MHTNDTNKSQQREMVNRGLKSYECLLILPTDTYCNVKDRLSALYLYQMFKMRNARSRTCLSLAPPPLDL